MTWDQSCIGMYPCPALCGLCIAALHHMAELSICSRHHMARKPRNIHPLALTGHFAHPWPLSLVKSCKCCSFSRCLALKLILKRTFSHCFFSGWMAAHAFPHCPPGGTPRTAPPPRPPPPVMWASECAFKVWPPWRAPLCTVWISPGATPRTPEVFSRTLPADSFLLKYVLFLLKSHLLVF
jgi:hypothetical protein